MKAPSSKSRFWSNKDIFDLGAGLANVFLVLACLILVPYLVAPLFGGKFLTKALVAYGSWIGVALIMKYMLGYVRDKVRMKRYKWYFVSSYFVLCWFLWFPNYLGVVFSMLIIISSIVGFRAQGRTGWQDEI